MLYIGLGQWGSQMASIPEDRFSRQLVLSDSKLLRLTAVALFYFTQGIPTGFFYYALPAWLASQGASAGDIASVVAATALPTSLKFANGFILDRYTYLPMGRRRVWIIGAQFALTATFVTGMVLAPTSSDIALLAAIGFAAALSFSFQDVGIDSLAIDIMESNERAKAASVMFGSQMVGMALMTWLGGLMLEAFGVSAAFACAALAPAAVLIFGILIRERQGEKQLPWSKGKAHPRNISIQVEAWRPLLHGAFRALLAPASLILVAILFARAIPAGITETLHPLIVLRETGWKLSELTNVSSLAQLSSGIAALLLLGAVVDRIGPQRALTLAAFFNVLLFAGIAAARPVWSSSDLMTAYIFAYEFAAMFFAVSLIPLVMRICSPAVAAAQFSIYMAAGNFGRPIGAALIGAIGADAAVFGFLILSALFLCIVLIALFQRFPDNSALEKNCG